MNKPKTLYVSDLDGTLLDVDSHISRRSVDILNALAEDGALITVATARTPATVVPLLTGVDIAREVPAVVMTGASMYNRAVSRYEDVSYIPASDVAHVLDICWALGVHPFVYILDKDAGLLRVYHGGGSMNRAEKDFYEERRHLALKHFHLRTPAPVQALADTVILFAMGQQNAVLDVAARLREETDCYISAYPDIFNPGIANLEILAPGVSKAAAISRLKARCGAERLVVFGDNLNDIPMLGIADVAVAVGNAMPEVKAAAHIVIDPNHADSVARFIRSDYYGMAK